MSRRAQENVVAGLLLCFFIGCIVMSLDFGPNAKLVPLPIASLGLLLVVLQILWQNVAGRRELHIDLFESLTLPVAERVTANGAASSESSPTMPDHTPTQENQTDQGSREWRAFGFVALFIVLIVLLGPVLAVFLFSGAYLLLSKHCAPWKALVMAAGFTAGVYLLFVIGLQLQLYHGILEPLIAAL